MEIQSVDQLIAEVQTKLPHLKPGEVSIIKSAITKARTQLTLNKVARTFNNTAQL